MPLHVSRSLPEIPPGPADYSPAKPQRVSPKASFPRTRRWTKDLTDHVPGPTDYHKTQRSGSVMWNNPRQPRFSSVPRGCGSQRLPPINPGPGAYTPNKSLASGHRQSFGRCKRWEEEKKREPEESPGPTSYRSTRGERLVQKTQPRQPKFSEVPRGSLPVDLLMARASSALM
uniref:Uncharacterized protein n=1 Tax=Alexandrium catenella TaxID=2925 RepID=A0A7S1RNI2_ALECA|mmetsp:Transcript_65772/g.175190  ORF Transcript_65772/g.175190 Transcript_65772/m.175190 type:complete len:173 (+) Transcript_65772:29-547(+)